MKTQGTHHYFYHRTDHSCNDKQSKRGRLLSESEGRFGMEAVAEDNTCSGALKLKHNIVTTAAAIALIFDSQVILPTLSFASTNRQKQ